jgi:hypothetical protein
VSRTISHLARCTPPTALVPLPSTLRQASHQRAVTARTTALASVAVTVPHRPPRARTVGHRDGRAKLPDGPPRRGTQAPQQAAGARHTPTLWSWAETPAQYRISFFSFLFDLVKFL